MTTEHPLRRWRRARDMTQGELAQLLGVRLFAVSRYERGERTPRPAVLARIRDVTGGAVTANDFLPPNTEAAE